MTENPERDADLPAEDERFSLFLRWEDVQIEALLDEVLGGVPEAEQTLRCDFEAVGVPELNQQDFLRVARILRFGTRAPTDFILLAEAFAGTELESYVFGNSLATAAFRRALAGWHEQRLRSRRRGRRRKNATPPLPEFGDE